MQQYGLVRPAGKQGNDIRKDTAKEGGEQPLASLCTSQLMSTRSNNGNTCRLCVPKVIVRRVGCKY